MGMHAQAIPRASYAAVAEAASWEAGSLSRCDGPRLQGLRSLQPGGPAEQSLEYGGPRVFFSHLLESVGTLDEASSDWYYGAQGSEMHFEHLFTGQ